MPLTELQKDIIESVSEDSPKEDFAIIHALQCRADSEAIKRAIEILVERNELRYDLNWRLVTNSVVRDPANCAA